MWFIKTQSRTIKVNEKNISENLSSWQKIIGFIPQNIFMIDDTLSTNIAFELKKKNIDRDKVIKIMKLTELDKDFSPENLIGENGSLLSGGQTKNCYFKSII